MNFREKDLQFDFDETQWSCLLKFDGTKDYEKAKNSLPKTKGVDFTGIFRNQSLVLIEVKDFRGHRIINKPRLAGGTNPLWLEIAQKNKNTIAIIVGAARNSTHEKEAWQSYLNILKNEDKSLHLILWLEQDFPPNTPKANQKKEREENLLRRNLKRSLRWLTSKVQVCNISTNPFSNALSIGYV